MCNYLLKLYLFCFIHLSCSKLHHRLKIPMTETITMDLLLNLKRIHLKNYFFSKRILWIFKLFKHCNGDSKSIFLTLTLIETFDWKLLIETSEDKIFNIHFCWQINCKTILNYWELTNLLETMLKHYKELPERKNYRKFLHSKLFIFRRLTHCIANIYIKIFYRY